MVKKLEYSVLIDATKESVWKSLTDPNLMKRWMGETEMEIEILTDWMVGSPIIIKGYHHVKFENKGRVLQFEPNRVLQYSHLSSISRLVDTAENYSIMTFNIGSDQNQTLLNLTVENFPTETIFKHLDFYWKTTLEILKGNIEGREALW